MVLKEWAKTQYREPNHIKTKTKGNLDEIHSKIEAHGTNQECLSQEKDLYWQLYHTNRAEEEKWRIKSRILWLQSGDKNTTFFHKHATVIKAKNSIASIIDTDGHPQAYQQKIKIAATTHFQEFLTDTRAPKDYFDLLQHLPTNITEEINSALNREIEEEAVKSTIWALHPDKALEPDGFSIKFYRVYWDLIKNDLVKMI